MIVLNLILCSTILSKEISAESIISDDDIKDTKSDSILTAKLQAAGVDNAPHVAKVLQEYGVLLGDASLSQVLVEKGIQDSSLTQELQAAGLTLSDAQTAANKLHEEGVIAMNPDFSDKLEKAGIIDEKTEEKVLSVLNPHSTKTLRSNTLRQILRTALRMFNTKIHFDEPDQTFRGTPIRISSEKENISNSINTDGDQQEEDVPGSQNSAQEKISLIDTKQLDLSNLEEENDRTDSTVREPEEERENNAVPTNKPEVRISDHETVIYNKGRRENQFGKHMFPLNGLSMACYDC